MDPGDISTALQMRARVEWKAGQARTTPNGKPLDGIRETTYWMTEIANVQNLGIADLLSSHLEYLESRRQFLEGFCLTGGSLEYFVGWFGYSNFGEVFLWTLLERLASLRIELSFDIYADKLSAVEIDPTGEPPS